MQTLHGRSSLQYRLHIQEPLFSELDPDCLKIEEEPITGLSIPQGQEACLFKLVFRTPVFPSSSPEEFAGKKC